MNIKKRRLFLVAVMLVMIFSLNLTGCGAINQTTAGQDAAKNMAAAYTVGGEPGTLDPQMSSEISDSIIELNLFEGLTRLDKFNLPQPAIAEKWDISSDGKTYTFHLRDSKFSNGDQLTADDFKYAWIRAMDPDNGSQYTYQVTDYIQGGRAYHTRAAKQEDLGIKVIDPQTLEVTLENPCPYFLSLVAFHAYYPVDTKIVAANKDWNQRPETLIGNGPFSVETWRHNDRMIIVKNPNYWDNDNVKLAQLTLFLMTDPKSAVGAYEAGTIDGYNAFDSPEDTERMQTAGDLKLDPDVATYFYRFNSTKHPFTDPRVRQALAMAIDRQQITNTITKTQEKPAFAFVPYSIPDDDNKKQFRDVGGDLFNQDVEQAKALLRDAGYPDKKEFPEITILYNNDTINEKVASAIRDMWSGSLGIRVNIRSEEEAVYQQSTQNLNYDVVQSTWTGNYLDPMTFLDMFVSGNVNNQTGWGNADYDKLIGASRSNGDVKGRIQQLHDAERILMNDMPITPIYFQVNKYIQKPYLENVVHCPLGLVDFKNATIEK